MKPGPLGFFLFYRQRCVQRNAPVFNLLRGWFWGFFAPRGDMLHRWGWKLARSPLLRAKFHPIGATVRVYDRKNWNICWYFIIMWNIDAPQGRILFAIFTKFAEIVPRFRMRWLLKFHWIYSRGYGVMGFSVDGVWLHPNLQRPIAAKLCVRPQTFWRCKNVLEVLYHHSKFGGARISPAAGVAKNVEFFVCLSVGFFVTLIWTLRVYAKWRRLFDVNFNIYLH